ncbi:MAG: hypothetical protein IJF40_06975 [Clostridia bacterium]|nr:hypothetical protein [Clostridia bacterium]MBQ7047188.1 hypothetical protein [Oscillospiraceae bacterium]
MTRDEAKKAFREVTSEEFADIPNEDEIEYEFSDEFNKKMESYFERVEYDSTHSFSKTKGTVLTIIAVAIILISVLMSISSVRESVVDFFAEKIDSLSAAIFEVCSPVKMNML